MTRIELVDVSELTDDEIQKRWEEAYILFETPEQEIKKFVRRLKKLGQQDWKREAQIVEIFCGRGNGLKALESLGFRNLEGVDISPDLLSRYDGPAKMYKADCRMLPFDSNSRDIIIVQGGLHHLPNLPEDLELTLAEVWRVLKPDGKFVMVEPWRTPFLDVVHFLSDRGVVRRFSAKFDAFAAMTHYEAETYFNWLSRSEGIMKVIREHFRVERAEARFGKLSFSAEPVK